ncbi:OB-fold-containig protein [Acinetobacter larvae]|uniref:Inner membrane protein YqiJ OB-fold domain-containing protein n=1 Tax=Acinetobacter larvae TaxID=1789224 RepID=A0A1B2M407_9GAMM|nr:OB-fold-containig protein [Acinetobacter larvae]AOA59937.1 hypothetical protein BFG52_08745 [Acinetobacter larvae]
MLQRLWAEPELIPYHCCVLSLFILSAAEIVGYYIKLRPSTFLKPILPQWISQSPLLQIKFSKILILVFLLLNLSFAGYFLQFCIYASQQHFSPWYYTIIPALILAIIFTVFMIHCLDQVIKPKVTTNAVNLIGRLATISSGSARPGFSAQARVRDEFGRLHYVQVEPEFGELELQSQVILIRHIQTHYIAKKVSASNHLFGLKAKVPSL